MVKVCAKVFGWARGLRPMMILQKLSRFIINNIHSIVCINLHFHIKKFYTIFNFFNNLLFNLCCASQKFFRIQMKIRPQGQFFAQITNLALFFRSGAGIKAIRAIENSLKFALFLRLNSHISVNMEVRETGSKVFLQRIIQ